MKIIVKPITEIKRPNLPVMAAVVASTTASREEVTHRAYERLVTGQGVHADRAKRLLGITK